MNEMDYMLHSPEPPAGHHHHHHHHHHQRQGQPSLCPYLGQRDVLPPHTSAPRPAPFFDPVQGPHSPWLSPPLYQWPPHPPGLAPQSHPSHLIPPLNQQEPQFFHGLPQPPFPHQIPPMSGYGGPPPFPHYGAGSSPGYRSTPNTHRFSGPPALPSSGQPTPGSQVTQSDSFNNERSFNPPPQPPVTSNPPPQRPASPPQSAAPSQRESGSAFWHQASESSWSPRRDPALAPPLDHSHITSGGILGGSPFPSTAVSRSEAPSNTRVAAPFQSPPRRPASGEGPASSVVVTPETNSVSSPSASSTPAAERRRPGPSRTRRAFSRIYSDRDREMDNDMEMAFMEHIMTARPGAMPDEHLRAAQFLRGAMSTKMVASPVALRSLESVDLAELDEHERSCIICYNDFGQETPEGHKEAPLRLPKCKHVFGDHCIKKWFEESDSCPYCRDKLPSEPRMQPTSGTFFNILRMRRSDGSGSGTESEVFLRSLGRDTDGRPWSGRRSPPSDSGENRRRIRARHGSRGSGSPPAGGNRPNSFASPSSSTSQHASPARDRPSNGPGAVAYRPSARYSAVPPLRYWMPPNGRQGGPPGAPVHTSAERDSSPSAASLPLAAAQPFLNQRENATYSNPLNPAGSHHATMGGVPPGMDGGMGQSMVPGAAPYLQPGMSNNGEAHTFPGYAPAHPRDIARNDRERDGQRDPSQAW